MGNNQSSRIEEGDPDISEAAPDDLPILIALDEDAAAVQQRDHKERRSHLGFGAALVAASIGAAFVWHQKVQKQNRKQQASYVGNFGKDKSIKIRFDYTPSEIEAEARKLIDRSQKVHDAVASIPLEKVTYASVIEPLSRIEGEEYHVLQALTFPAHVSRKKPVRDAAIAAETKLNAYAVRSSMRLDVYQRVKAFSVKGEELRTEEQRYVDRLVRDYERLGLNLDAATRQKVEALKTRCGELSINFQRNLNEENTILHFTADELAGMPHDFVKGLKAVPGEAGKLEVTLRYPHVFPLMKMCKVGATRRKVEYEFNRRCIFENVKIIEELIRLRHELATLLGYPTHAAYVLDVRMAKTPAAVRKFLEDVSDKMTSLADKELQQLKALKRAEEGEAALSMADFRYYMHQQEERHFKIDHQKIKEYFPMDKVTDGLLKIYQQLLGLQFTEVSSPHTWHEEVQLFCVHDAASGEKLGYFYLDLFPREGKYGHAAVWPLQKGCTRKDGSRQLPVAGMLANFSRPTADKPSLLAHNEVETYFHEFGHVMHNICSRVEMARFAGTSVERDFVEAPSQMLENWCWEKASLRLMSGHYRDGSPLPESLLDTLISTKKAHAGLLCKRQLFLGLLDQTVHTRAQADTAAVIQELHPKVLAGIPATAGTNMLASFGHLAGGYDASYYGYMWSEVFSADMFATKFAKDVLSPAAGKEYRDKILRPGGSIDAADMLWDFLGREPTEAAFLESKGV
ncbi:thimet oligopeptidase [Klebsormidium nitens]|uniref:Thimet oligopeptidase n=1 Tax=Klebsormidium nitens TaxID=105231 RepID=A0A1Y1IIW3_KLENI|nr:thimet oligopeptidase [Klebsormidium nitens]|eukprot:GAQ89369.1 thimet oligopeptidase [Klebsormidium nitens]